MTTRIYEVHDNDTGITHLVEATSPSVARSHVAKSKFAVCVATTKVVAQLVSDGTKVQVAGEQAEEESIL